MKSFNITSILRILLGLLLLVFGLNKFISFMPPMDMPDQASAFIGALVESGYMIPLVGIVEVVIGAFLVFRKYVPFALVVLAPLSVHILLFHLFLNPAAIFPGLIVAVLNVFLMIKYRGSYTSLFCSCCAETCEK